VVYSCWFLGQIARARLRRLPSNRITLLLHSRDLRATLCTLHRDVFGNHPFAGNPGISRTQGQVPPRMGERGLGSFVRMVRSGWSQLLCAFLPELFWHLRTHQPAQIDHRDGCGFGDWQRAVCIVQRYCLEQLGGRVCVSKWYVFPLLLALSALLVVLIQTNHPLVIYPVMVVSGLGVSWC